MKNKHTQELLNKAVKLKYEDEIPQDYKLTSIERTLVHTINEIIDKINGEF